MTTKPFRVGDRIKYQEKIAEVFQIRFVYTKLRHLDNTEISVPNQEFLIRCYQLRSKNTYRHQIYYFRIELQVGSQYGYRGYN